MHLDARVKEVREALQRRIRRSGLTQAEVADRCGWSQGTLADLLSARGPQPSLTLASTLAVLEALGESPEEFFSELYPLPRAPAGDEERILDPDVTRRMLGLMEDFGNRARSLKEEGGDGGRPHQDRV